MHKRKVFEGVKVADFAWVAVGPQVSRELAEHGATVVHIECHRKVDTLRALGPYRDAKSGINRTAFGTMHNTNKYGISLDLTKPKGHEVARKLVKWADVVTESMTPGTMKKLGLDYESCQEIKPDIIYYSTCQTGQYGPWANFGGYGGHASALAGFHPLCGWPDRDPVVLYGAYTDYISPWYLATDLIGALLHRRRTGEGMYLEQSQLEAGVTFLGPALLDYAANGRIASRLGNRDPYAVPHGVYPCRGTGRWVAIAVYTDEEWQAFCRVLGHPDWTREFATLLSRKENEDELDTLVAEWTRGYSAEEVMAMMQGVGVAAGISQTAEDLLEHDPQLKHRQHFVQLMHKVIGPHHYRAPTYKLSKTPAELYKAAPCVGEDNEYVYKQIVGLSDDEIAELLMEHVITTEADLPSGP